MQQLEMWLDVLAWMGWNNIRPNTAPHNEYKGLIGTKGGRNLPIPELTLDALHEAEKQLSTRQKNHYLQRFQSNIDLNGRGVFATKSQRLLALWRTIRK